ncbi:hypothetical protein QYF36_018622 [Acer negundo]|nr:hypothetical protein QYF36_018622 [Acer negundo]
MKASGSLQKNYYCELRSPPPHTEFSRITGQSRGLSGKMTVDTPELDEVQRVENDGFKKVMMVDDPMAEVMKSVETWDSRNTANFNAINATTINAINVIKPIDEKLMTAIEVSCQVGLLPQVATDKGIIFRLVPRVDVRRDLEGKVVDEAQKVVIDDGSYVFKGGPSDSQDMGYKWVRKIRFAGIGDFGGKLEPAHANRIGDLVIIGDDFVLKKRRVAIETVEAVDRCQVITKGEGPICTTEKEDAGCIENLFVGPITQTEVSTTEETEKLLAS